MAINETRKEKIKSDIFVLSLKFFSLPIIVAIIFLFYVFMLKKDINILLGQLYIGKKAAVSEPQKILRLRWLLAIN